jgi:hypothetical protein
MEHNTTKLQASKLLAACNGCSTISKEMAWLWLSCLLVFFPSVRTHEEYRFWERSYVTRYPALLGERNDIDLGSETVTVPDIAEYSTVDIYIYMIVLQNPIEVALRDASYMPVTTPMLNQQSLRLRNFDFPAFWTISALIIEMSTEASRPNKRALITHYHTHTWYREDMEDYELGRRAIIRDNYPIYGVICSRTDIAPQSR